MGYPKFIVLNRKEESIDIQWVKRVLSSFRTVINTGEVLVEVLKQALSQGRITYGVFECVELLET